MNGKPTALLTLPRRSRPAKLQRSIGGMGWRRTTCRRTLLCLAILCLVASRGGASAPNLLSNPGFDTGTTAWDPDMFGGVGTATWNPSDARGNVHSGSVLIEAPEKLTAYFISQCVPATAGTSYVAGASVWPDQLAPGDAVEVEVDFLKGPNCTGFVVSGPQGFATVAGGWADVAILGTAPPNTLSARVLLQIEPKGSTPVAAYFDNVFLHVGGCAPSPTQLCLNQGRFQVQATWTKPDHTSGPGMAVPLSADSGGFWFFDPTNLEMDVKVLDACVPALGNRYWVFAAGLTNVKVVLTVTDTQNATVKTYINRQNQVFQPITDVGAFATCP